MNIKIIAHRLNIGSDVVLAAKPQLANGSFEWNLVDATIDVEVVGHELFLVVVALALTTVFC